MAYDPHEWVKSDLIIRPRSRWSLWLLGLGLLLSMGLTITAPFDRSADPHDWINMFPIMVPIILGLHLSPYSRDSWMGSYSAAKYDEFEISALSKATGSAYFIFIALCFGLAIWCWAGTLYGVPVPSRPYDWSAVIVAIIFMASSLPTFIAELAVPFPPEEVDKI